MPSDHADKAESHAESAGGHLANSMQTAVDAPTPPAEEQTVEQLLLAAQLAATLALVEAALSIGQRLADLEQDAASLRAVFVPGAGTDDVHLEGS